MLYKIVYGDRYDYTTEAPNEQVAVVDTLPYVKVAIFIDWIMYMRAGSNSHIDTDEENMLELARAWCRITAPRINYMTMSFKEIIDAIVVDIPVPVVTKVTCDGCMYDLPGQLSHMGVGGCLWSEDFDDRDEDLIAQLND